MSAALALLRLYGVTRPADLDGWEIGLRELDGADWARMAGLASYHGFSGLLARNLEWARVRCGVDAPILEPLAATRRKVLAQNLAHKAAGRAAAEALERAGVPFVVLKGVVLAEEVYGDLSLRGFNDFDVMVPYEHIERAYEVVAAMGYSLTRLAHVNDFARLGAHAANMARRDGSSVDLHWSLAPDLAAEAVTRVVWRDCVPAPPGSTFPGLRLSPEMSLVHLAKHFHSHQYGTLKPLVDLHVTAQTASAQVDPAKLLASADALGLRPVLEIAAMLCDRYLGGRAQCLEPLRRTDSVSTRFARRVVTEDFLVDSVSRSRIGNWARYLAGAGTVAAAVGSVRETVFPSRLVLAQFFNEPFGAALYPRYYWRQVVKVLTLSPK